MLLIAISDGNLGTESVGEDWLSSPTVSLTIATIFLG